MADYSRYVYDYLLYFSSWNENFALISPFPGLRYLFIYLFIKKIIRTYTLGLRAAHCLDCRKYSATNIHLLFFIKFLGVICIAIKHNHCHFIAVIG